MNKLKSIICWGGIMLLALPVVGEEEKNAVSMVTYFPVPYAAYNNIYVNKKFDVGTNQGSFTLHLGSADSSISLLANDIFLRNISANNSALSFTTDIYTPTAQFGKWTNSTGTAELQFKNLRIDSALGTSGDYLKDVDVENLNILSGDMYLNTEGFRELNGARLPACKGVDGAPNVSWQQHRLEGDSQDRYFLVCGEAKCADGSAPVDGKCGVDCDKCAQDTDYLDGNKSNCCSSCAENSTFGSPLRGECHDFKWNSVIVAYWRHPDPSAGGSC